jgi:Zn-dependent protease with chaperone function
MPSHGDPGGFLLSLVTESFAVRALVGSLAAAGLAAMLVGAGIVRTRRARRLAILTPVLTAAVAAVASIGEVYLPQLWVATGAGPEASMLEALGEQRGLITERGIDALVLTYGLVVSALVARRVLGIVAVRRTLQRGRSVASDGPLTREVARLAAGMGVAAPRLVLVPECPGGSFTTGARRAVVAVDPLILARLDEREREGLLAHELAHLRRRDTALALLIGLFRDVAFFLPPLHVAARWLRREQEEGADELASRHTGRPVALASSILKVWDCSRDRRALAGVCAAVPGRAAALPSGLLVGGPSLGVARQTITARGEGLIARVPAPTTLRQWVEGGLASVALLAGTTAALTVPAWINGQLGGQALSFVYLSAPPERPVEAAAFATFRALTPSVAAVSAGAAAEPAPWRGGFTQSRAEGCPCIETRAQLRDAEPARGRDGPNRLAWGSTERPAWDVRLPGGDTTVRTARPLVLISDTGPRVGVFLVGPADR